MAVQRNAVRDSVSVVSMLIAGLLRARLKAAGADPLITYYDAPSGERVELSAITFDNWVAKAANLLTCDLSVAQGESVALPLARSAPGHWMTAVWQVAAWHAGAYVDLSSAPAEVVVCGPDWQPYADSGADVLACSLHPLGGGLGSVLPASVSDVDLAVRSQPDSYDAAPIDPAGLAWVDAERRLTQADLVVGPGTARRRLVVPGEPWDSAREGIIAALLGGGSIVVVVGGTADDLARIRTAELVEEG
jgi:uncharacterized protein (TIGR03089 family)